MTQLTVVINAVSAKSGGAATYLRNLLPVLSAAPHRFVVCAPSEIARAAEAAPNLEILANDVAYGSVWRRLQWDQMELRRLVAARQAHVLLASSDFGMLAPPCPQILFLRNPLFFSSLYQRLILPKKTAKFRIDFALRRTLIRGSIKASSAVFTASESMLADVRAHLPVDGRIAVVNPMGVPLARFESLRRRGDRPERPFTLLYVAEYSDYKNLTVLLEAMKALGPDGARLITTASPDQFENVEIVTRDRDRVLSKDPDVSPYVTFTGRVSYESIHELYAQADAFVFPSYAESFGHPLVEAMRCGLPIIASDIAVHREMCADAAIYFTPTDVDDLIEKVTRLRSSAELRDELSTRGRARVAERFDFNAHVKRLLTLIEDVAIAA